MAYATDYDGNTREITRTIKINKGRDRVHISLERKVNTIHAYAMHADQHDGVLRQWVKLDDVRHLPDQWRPTDLVREAESALAPIGLDGD